MLLSLSWRENTLLQSIDNPGNRTLLRVRQNMGADLLRHGTVRDELCRSMPPPRKPLRHQMGGERTDTRRIGKAVRTRSTLSCQQHRTRIFPVHVPTIGTGAEIRHRTLGRGNHRGMVYRLCPRPENSTPSHPRPARKPRHIHQGRTHQSQRRRRGHIRRLHPAPHVPNPQPDGQRHRLHRPGHQLEEERRGKRAAQIHQHQRKRPSSRRATFYSGTSRHNASPPYATC